ncbi:MAG TPA: hypothetical protein VGA95_03425 [Thermodesulfobacteriota bacterium]
MSKIRIIIPFICLITGCSTFYPYRDVKPDKDTQTREYERKTEEAVPPITKGKKPPLPGEKETVEAENVFNASFTDVWFATLEGVQWIKWSPAFMDEKTGEIVLKEAYVYKKSGNIIRAFTWPFGQIQNFPDIDDYLNKVAFYNTSSNVDRPVFSQESMRIKVIKLSNTKTKVDIDYTIRPYLDSATFAEEIKSNNYIETLLLVKIKEKLQGSYINTSYLEN